MLEPKYYILLKKCIFPIILATITNITYHMTSSWLSELENNYFDNYDQIISNIKKESYKILKNKLLSKKSVIIDQKLEKLESLLSTEINLPDIINEIYKLSNNYGVEIKSINYIYPTHNESNLKFIEPPKIHVQMQLSANYLNVRKFLCKLNFLLNYPILITEVTATKDNIYQINLINLVKDYE